MNNKSLPIPIKRFDKELPLPAKHTAGAVAYDLAARLDTTIPAQSFGYIPLNIALKIPAGYWVLLAARSSTHKRGLLVSNGIGIGDADFCGDSDEYQLAVYNLTQKPVTVERGARIAQLMILPVPEIDFQEVEKLVDQDRGGFGSTG